MRTIKFQGVDDNNRLYDLHAINYFNMTGLCQVEGVNGWCWCRFKEFRQFTGLTDKNGKEIYEGDILLFKTFGFDSEIFMASIIWKTSGFALSNSRNLFYHGQMDLTKIDDAEIIGNIYNNPELLKQ